MRTNQTVIGALAVKRGDADALICGVEGRYARHLRDVSDRYDFDAIRFVTGREVESVYATGSTKGGRFYRVAGDLSTGVAVLTLDDGTMALVSASRHNGGGHDIRREVHGSEGSLAPTTLRARTRNP